MENRKKRTRVGTNIIITAYLIFIVRVLFGINTLTLYDILIWFSASSAFAIIGLLMNRSDKKTGHKPQPMPLSMHPINNSTTKNKEGV